MAVTDDTQGKRSSGKLTAADTASQAYDTKRNNKTPLRLWLAWVPIPALIVSMAAIYFAVKPTVFFEPAWLLPITNALFVTAVCFIVAYVAMKNYLATGRIQILLLGCGLLSFGLGGVIAGWVRSFPGGANLNVTIYNTAALVAGAFHFVAAFILLAGVSPETGAKHKHWWLGFSYAAIAAFTFLFTVAALWRVVPPFFIQGVGPTAVRQVVLGSADALFVFSFLIFMGWYLRRREAFLCWYALALALTAISLTGFFIESAVGSPIGWLSRFSQYLGGVYFLIAIATAIRTAHARKTSIDFALAASLSPSEESFLRTTFDNMAERLIVCDSQGNVLLVNDAARKTYGMHEPALWEASRLTEEAELFALDGRPLPLSLRPLTRVLRGEQVRSTELLLQVKATGQELILSYNGTPIRDRNGSVALAVLTAEDITERKRVEESLRESEALLQVTMENLAEAVIVSDPLGNVLHWNRPGAAMFGYESPEQWRVPLARFAETFEVAELDGTVLPVEQWPLSRILRGESLRDLEIRLRRWNSDWQRIFSYSGNLVRDLDGHPLLAVVSVNDITEHKRAEEAVRESQAKLKAAIESLSEAIFISDAEGRLVNFNDGFIKYHRFKDRVACSKNVFECPNYLDTYFADGTPAPIDMWAMPRALRGEVASNVEYRLCRKDTGESWWGSYNFAPIRDQDGTIIGSVVSARDITERKRAEEALLRSEKLASVGRMAATIAHEINNPLEAVTNLLFITKSAKDLESVRQYLGLADAELERIAHITRQSLGFYRESNAPALTSVNAVLESAVDLLKNKIKAKSAVIEKQWDGDVQVTAVAGELRQVFTNLLANSLDAIDGEGKIKLRVSVGSGVKDGHRCVRVTVADNGKGISPGSRQHIFQPFFTTKGTVGTGLGLWVSKQIIEKHGGTIRMRSSSNGARRGTVFSIVLPVEPAVAARSQSAGA